MTTDNELDLGVSLEDLQLDELRYDGRSGRFSWRSQPDTDLGKSFVLVILGELPRSRVLYGLRVGDPTRCASPDAIAPVPPDPAVAAALGTGPFCNVCKYGQWEEGKDGKRIKPECSESLNFACAEVDQPQPVPFKLSVRGTGIRTFANRNDGIMTIRAREAIKHRTPAYAIVIEIAAGPRMKTNGQDYFPLTGRVLMDGGRPLTVEPALFGLYSELRGVCGVRAPAGALRAPAPRPALPAADDEDRLPLFDADGNELATAGGRQP